MKIADIAGQSPSRRRIRRILRSAGFRIEELTSEQVSELPGSYNLAILCESLLDRDRSAFEVAVEKLAGSETKTAIIFRDRSLHLRSWLDKLNDRSIYIHAGDPVHVARIIALALVYEQAEEGLVGQLHGPLGELITA